MAEKTADEKVGVETLKGAKPPYGDEKVFGKYELTGISIPDPSLGTSISIKASTHTHGRAAKHAFGKTGVSIVERLANKLMRGGTGAKTSGKIIRTHGKLQGKKLKALKIVEAAFDDVAKRTGKNPVQLLIIACANSAPREDVTRVAFGGVSYQVAVDVSASRRLDMALRNIALAAIMKAFDSKKTLAEALADEIDFASKGDANNSFAIKKRDETERMSRSSR